MSIYGGVWNGFLHIIVSLPTHVDVELGCDNLIYTHLLQGNPKKIQVFETLLLQNIRKVINDANKDVWIE